MKMSPIDQAMAARGIKMAPGDFARAGLPLDRALDHVPAGTEVRINIYVPDNRIGRLRTFQWRADRGMTPEKARAAIGQELFKLFFDLTMPKEQ